MKTYLLSALSFALLACTANPVANPDEANAKEAGDKAASANVAKGKDAGANAAPAARSAAAPATEEGLDWALRIDEEVRTRPAILAFEMDGTDDQRLNFTCEEGGARVFAGITGGAASLNAITLVSGDQTLRLSGTTESDDEDMPNFTSQEIAGNSPFLAAFAQNGWLSMTADGAKSGMTAASSGGKKAIKDFVAHCTKKG